MKLFRRNRQRFDDQNIAQRNAPAPIAFALEPRIMFDGAAPETWSDLQVPPHPEAEAISEPQPVQSGPHSGEQEGNHPLREVAVIDTGIAEYQSLIDALKGKENDGADTIEVVLIEGGQSGLARLAAWAQHREQVDTLHLFTHGSPGLITLGSDVLTFDTLKNSETAAVLAALGHALTEDGNILIHGCTVAAHAEGNDFITLLAHETGADVAASIDATGASRLGGDWDLERATGPIESNILEHLARNDPFDHLLETVTFVAGDLVNNTDAFTKSIGGQTFTITPGSSPFINIQTDIPALTGLYVLNSDLSAGNGTEFTLAAPTNYTFDLGSFQYTSDRGAQSLTLTLTLIDNTTDAQTYATTGNSTVQTFNTFTTAAEDVRSIKFVTNELIYYNNFVITDVKPIPTAPTVASVSSDTANGSYKVGDTVDVKVTFSEAVTVTGTPQITLETGTTDRTVDYSSGSGTTELHFTYTVQASDTSSDLDVTGTTALALNGGTIASTATTTNATLTLAAPGAANSLGNAKALVIDTTAPTVASVTSTTANGTYKTGDAVNVTVNFSENVTVTGTPTLTLETGTTDRTIDYVSGSGTSALVFTYTVQAGDTSADLDYTATTALALGGGSINDTAGNAATLTLATPGAANSLGNAKALVIDTTAPTVSSVTSTTANGTYKTGDAVNVTVNFSENVTVTGTPTLTLETGTTDRTVDYVSGSGTSALVFTYTVQAGDSSADLDTTATTALALNGGSINDGAGNSATLTLAAPGAANSLGNAKALVIDGVAPTVASVSSSTADGSYKAGDAVNITVNFSENVTVTGTPTLTLETGTTDRTIDYVSGTGSSALVFTYTVSAGDTASDLDYTATNALSLNGGGIADSAGNSATLTLAAPGAANSLGNSKALVIDTTVPTVTSVTSTSNNGTYYPGNTINVTVTFSEAVTVTGTPTITLETGTTDRDVAYASGSGTNTLVFTYTVQSGDNSADLDYTATTALSLGGGSINDTAGNAATLTLAAPGAANSLGANKALVVALAPSVTSVSATTANGSYKSGDAIAVTVTFSEAVTVTGTPTITLETGTTDRNATYASGSGTTTLTFNYTVQAGDGSGDLDYTATNALGLNGGTIQNGQAVAASLTLASPGAANSLGANKAIVIDTTSPTVSSVNATTGDGSYKQGDTINIIVNFSEAITVATGGGTPYLTLETGTTDRNATYASGTGSTTLVFSYTVQAGDTSSDLEAVSTAALVSNGGTLKDTAGNDATLTLASPGAANSLGANRAIVIDTTSPTVSSVSAFTANGSYNGGIVIVTVTFSEAITVASGIGAPYLTLETGTIDRNAIYINGSGSTSLAFLYIVQAGDTSSDLDAVSTAALVLNGSTFKDAAGNDATLTLASPGAANSLGANKAIVIDTTSPTVSSVTSTTANGSYKQGDTVNVTVTFSEAITVATGGGTPYLTLETGTTDRNATYASGSGSTDLVFSYTVQAGDTSSDLDAVSTAALVSNGGTLRDAAGNDATLTLASPGAANSFGANKAIVIDTTSPTVTSVGSTTANGTYFPGNTIDITVLFSEAVTVTGTPTLTLETGTTDRSVNYSSGSGTTTLVFSYTVQTGDLSNDLDYTTTTALALNGGTINDAAGNAATLTLATPGNANSLGNAKAIVLASLPTVTDVTSSTANGLYKVGDTLALTVTFTEAVTVTGTPTITLETGTTDRSATYASGSGTTTLTFNYTVQAGDGSGDLDYTATNALGLNGGTIQNGQAVAASLTLASPGAANSLGANKAIVIDTTSPTVSSVTSTTADGSYKQGDTVNVTVTFSEAITVTTGGGTSYLTLETGTTDRNATYASGSGSTSLVFSYIVQAGDTSSDLDAVSTAALVLNGSTFKDAAGNDATLTLASPGAVNSLGNAKAIVIDTTPAVVNRVSSITSNGTYKEGDTLRITVHFSENVTVTQTPTLTLETGKTDRAVNYASGSGTDTLTFTYTIQPGDVSEDLDTIATTALALNGGTIADAAGNAASLLLPTPGSSRSLGQNKDFLIDTTPPAVVQITSTAADTTFKSGETIPISVHFSETVFVTATPGLTLETGTTDRTARYRQGSGSSTLVFDYTVAEGDFNGDLDLVALNPLSLDGATIKDGAGHAASTLLPDPGTPLSLGGSKNIVADGMAPAILSITSPAVDGTYKEADRITVTLHFSEAVLVTGTPTLTLETGTTDREAIFSGGSGTTAIDFSYTVQQGDASSNLDITGPSALSYNGGAIRDPAGNPADLALPSPGSTRSLGHGRTIIIDTAATTPSTPVTPETAPSTAATTTPAASSSNTTPTASTPNPTPLIPVPPVSTPLVTSSVAAPSTTATPGIAPTGPILSSSTNVAAVVTFASTGANLDINNGPIAPIVTFTTSTPPPTTLPATSNPSAPTSILAPSTVVSPSPLVDTVLTTFPSLILQPSTTATAPSSPPPVPPAAPTPTTPGPTAPTVSPSGTGTTPPSPSGITLTSNAGFPVASGTPAIPPGASGLFLADGIPDMNATIGGNVDFSVPSTAFAHSDGNAVVQLSAQQADGQSLPNWLQFDPRTGKFSGQPPEGFDGNLNIKVIARDNNGREAVAVFRVKMGQERTGNTDRGASWLHPSAIRPVLARWGAMDRDQPIQEGSPGLSRQLAHHGRTGWIERTLRLQHAAERMATSRNMVSKG
ncbi:MAG: DUF4347 domain-containing protein [Magnetococcales bacterium]|nr:DUF4347 domain-containing protein [Magnetococcales bacterium]